MFILWLKHFLAERDLQYRLDSSKCDLTDASFGLEHLFREMGQIYEAVSSSETKDAKLEELKEQLSLITARMLLLGHPFEIMDGDTANVPITWVDAVLMNLKDIIGDKKVLTISVLGAQGSGKSTLLSTMFGLQFDVSSRRCTRGVFMHLVPVYDTSFPFEWILVIYTDGLRALEPGHQNTSRTTNLQHLSLVSVT
ncbi:Interferon-induced very large GTPase 1 [Mytilus edulis]|uniref:Interferon-induced very large GTPase 1 n=1 Tax=Mytilus edulis TaxID=6550 RepID=A0A8S3U0T8_MYTED|nr:Interferon-induced very large GTPase 1 [Mytilus edulis]